MKRLILLLALVLPLVAGAVKIVTDEIDEFTGKRTVITSWESLNSTRIHIRFRLQAGKEFLDFKFRSEDAIVIKEKGLLLFKSTSDSIGKFLSNDIYHGGIGDGAVGLNGSGVWGISASYTGNLEWFATNVTRLLRVYATDGYYDRTISEGDGKKLCKLYDLFAKTVHGQSGALEFANYTIQFVKKSPKATTWELVKEESLTDKPRYDIQKLMDDWKAQTNDKAVYDCKVQKSK